MFNAAPKSHVSTTYFLFMHFVLRKCIKYSRYGYYFKLSFYISIDYLSCITKISLFSKKNAIKFMENAESAR